MSCALCERRKPRRDCPALSRSICGACCGRYRELTLDCPATCPHLVAAYRYEWQRPLPAAQQFRPDFHLTRRQMEENQALLLALLEAVQALHRRQRDLSDADVAAALESRLQALETEQSGLIYDASPAGGLRRELYRQLAAIEQTPIQAAALAPAAAASREQRIVAYVWLIRILRTYSSMRARARGFLVWMNDRFPAHPAALSSPLVLGA